MKLQKSSFYRTPIGTEGLYLEEAYRHRRIVQGMEQIFDLWGYLPVHTPVFDYFDLYQPLLSEKAKSQAYRFFDREGDSLLLRNDTTLFLARALGIRLDQQDLPLRVFYADSLLRHEDREDISANEFFQMGAELLGLPGADGDREILLILQEILQYLKLPSTQIHVGSRKIAKDALSRIDTALAEKILHTAEIPDPLEVESLLDHGGLSVSHKNFLTELFTFMGNLDQAQELIAKGQSQGWLSNSDDCGFLEIQKTLESLERLNMPIPTVVDFSEVGVQDYYTGLVFRAYTQGVGSPIASGGRYDDLVGSFGTPCPSVGFSLMSRKIEGLAGEASRFTVEETPTAAGAGDFESRYKKAQELRAQGKATKL